MAIALLSTGLVTSQTSTTTYTHVAGAMPVGTLVIIGATNSGGAAFSTVTDNSTQTGAANSYTKLASVTSGTARVQVAYCYLTRALLSTDTITIVMSGSSPRAAIAFYSFSGANATPLDQSATKGVSTSPISVGPTGALSNTNELAINMVGWFGGAVTSGAASTTAGYTLGTPGNSGGVTNRVEIVPVYKIGVGTAAETSVVSFTSITSAAGNLLTFKAAGGTVYTQSLSGALSFSGSTPVKQTTRTLPAALSFSGGATRKQNARLLGGGFSPTGTLGRAQALGRLLDAAILQPAGAILNTSTARTIAASLTPSGALSSLKAIGANLSGALTFSGSQTHVPAKVLPASLTPSGSLSAGQTLARALTAAFAATSSAFTKLTARTLPAAFTPTGMVAASRRGVMPGALSFVGSVANSQPARTLTAALSFVGGIAQRQIARRLFASLRAAGVLHSHYIPPVKPPFPGGGGYGGPMPDSFFTRYKPTLRKQR